MTLHQKIGQMLLFGWSGDTPEESRTVNAHAAALVDEFGSRRHRPNGAATSGRLSRRGRPPRLRNFRHEQKRTGTCRRCSALAVDQEGGRVQQARRLPTTLPTPAARVVGDTGNPEQARVAARRVGEGLRAVGFNWDFAPVLGREQQPQKPGHRGPGVWLRPGPGCGDGGGGGARVPGRRGNPGLRQALPRPWRHGDGFTSCPAAYYA